MMSRVLVQNRMSQSVGSRTSTGHVTITCVILCRDLTAAREKAVTARERIDLRHLFSTAT